MILTLSENHDKFGTLVDIIARLQAPDGCPWDRKQTHATLRENMLAECYEVLEALDEGDSGKLCEELGDLLMQIVLHARLASDSGEFEMADVISGISNKLIHRHPHVFGRQQVDCAEEVAYKWEELKKAERGSDTSILASVPKEMPALGYSKEIQRRVAYEGFDWENIDGVIDKLVEEVREFKQADSQSQKEREFGDILFTLVNIARRMDIDSEVSLRETNRRFSHRFTYMEEICRKRNVTLGQLSFNEQNALWEEVKRGTEGNGRGGQI